MKGLTKRQQEILDFITRSIQDNGYPPTIREIGRQMGIKSTNGVNDHLKALERKGFLDRTDLKSRAMRPVNLPTPPVRRNDDTVEIPVLGRVAAGEPILAVEDAEDTVRVDRFLLGGQREVFALRIVGESMIEDGILDGDYVFVRKTPSANKGDTVIAMIEGEATCKRFYREGDRIRLQPANSTMAPIYIHARDFRQTMILGKVVGVYRRL
ncbi:MAG: transcriptional repressor LexA [Myxococcales bacterium]|nr:transcriptional repressor LexA [Myxococcales bacterium]